MIDLNIIRAYDIRGIVGETLTPQIMAKIGYLLGKEGEEIVVGNDIRDSGRDLAKALISGLLARKSKVHYSGTGSFGQILFSGIGKGKILFITASHLTKEWNGLKMFYGDGLAIPCDEIEAKIKNKINSLGEVPIFDNAFDMISNVDPKDDYKNYFKEKFNLGNFKVVVDCNCGSTCLSAPHVLKDMGMNVVAINDSIDPTFRNASPKVDPEFIQELKERVITENAHIGMAFDGDGDRVAIIDESGRILSGNEIGALLGKHYTEKGKGKIINTVSCSMVGEKLLKPLGAEIKTVEVGHTFVGNACKKHEASLGYEESGHIFLPEYFYFDDAFVVPLKIMEIMNERNMKLSELINEIPIYPFLEKSFVTTDDKKFDIMKNITNKLKNEYQNTNDLDGIKVMFDDGWILIRCSNTNPKIRLYVEALTKERFKELEDKFTKILEEEINK